MSAAVETLLTRHFAELLAPPRSVAGGPLLPVVRPQSRGDLTELLAFARVEGLGLLPLGGGTKLDATPAPPGLDLLVDTSAFGEVIAFEPGDGTLTAGGGARLDDLVALAASGGRTLVPTVAPGATLGGVIATAESGTDRLARGPVREHVLGLEVLLADGLPSRSGGRLVKNVAGYDLHRLHTGAWGGLGIVLEATLRLFPAWRRETSLVAELPDLTTAVELVGHLFAARVAARRVRVTQQGPGPVELVVDLAGREDVVAAELETCAGLLPSPEERPPAPPEPRPDLVLQALPSAAGALAQHAEACLALLPAGARLDLDPLLARAALAIPRTQPGTPLVPLPSVPRRVTQVLPRPTASSLGPGAAALARALEHSLDPRRVFARP